MMSLHQSLGYGQPKPVAPPVSRLTGYLIEAVKDMREIVRGDSSAVVRHFEDDIAILNPG